ncbi:hypothetical protein EFP26_07705 [Lactobacillus johnsonii]|nr:hypothetical protein F8243_00480 [Lactobacillus johnsonii]MCT3345806.1 hypothetical protein [Lactobacillus johnsonii]MCT3381540.1 hypothetical protein [Lactobacillus johnsonii]MCT3383684.1 hypothetical protein [Lactobacillus johnsonii]PWF23496.1 hypothetical protein DF212_02310 [Lactobacillus johnsonii]
MIVLTLTKFNFYFLMLGKLILKINSIFLKASKREHNKVESENIYFIRIISEKIGFFLKTLSKKNGTIKPM